MINNENNSISIIQKITSGFIPGCKIILFGSRARKNFFEESDYDFLVITKETYEEKQKRILKSMIRKELAKFKIPSDILIQSETEIELKKEITGHIIKQVLKEGVVL